MMRQIERRGYDGEVIYPEGEIKEFVEFQRRWIKGT